jgi:hypothetical protein
MLKVSAIIQMIFLILLIIYVNLNDIIKSMYPELSLPGLHPTVKYL